MSSGIRHLVILASTLGVFSQLTALTVRGAAGYNYVAILEVQATAKVATHKKIERTRYIYVFTVSHAVDKAGVRTKT